MLPGREIIDNIDNIYTHIYTYLQPPPHAAGEDGAQHVHRVGGCAGVVEHHHGAPLHAGQPPLRRHEPATIGPLTELSHALDSIVF